MTEKVAPYARGACRALAGACYLIALFAALQASYGQGVWFLLLAITSLLAAELLWPKVVIPER